MHNSLKNKFISEVSAHIEEDSNRKFILDPPPELATVQILPQIKIRVPGIVSPYNVKAFNMEIDSNTSISRIS